MSERVFALLLLLSLPGLEGMRHVQHHLVPDLDQIPHLGLLLLEELVLLSVPLLGGLELQHQRFLEPLQLLSFGRDCIRALTATTSTIAWAQVVGAFDA